MSWTIRSKAFSCRFTRLTDRHGSDDLKVIFDKANEHWVNLKDQMTKNDMTLESARSASMPEGWRYCRSDEGSQRRADRCGRSDDGRSISRPAMRWRSTSPGWRATSAPAARPYLDQKGDLDLENQRD